MNDAPLQNRAVYELIADAYEQRQLTLPRGWGAVLLEEFAASLATGSLIVDIGCGPGFDASALAAAGHRVIGLDFTFAMLQRAKSRHSSVVQADMRALPLESGSVDAVWSSYALLHIPAEDLGATIAGVRRILRPDGRVCLIFAAGVNDAASDVSTELEDVEYRPELTRTYVYVQPTYVRELMTSAGFVIDTFGAEPGASRGAFWVLAHAA